MPTIANAVMLLLSLVLLGCVDVVIYPDDVGDDEDSTTTAMDSTDTTGGNETTDSTDGPVPDLPSDETTTEESTGDESTEESTGETGEDDAVCCTCPDAGSSEYQCWDWNGQTSDSCTQAQAMALGEQTTWCTLDMNGYPADCLDQCR